MERYARQLLKTGVTVIPVLGNSERRSYNEKIHEAMRTFPEYLDPANALHVKGAFGALGNPASFYNQPVRDLRKLMHQFAMNLFPLLEPNKNLEQLLDRLSFRRKGTTLGGENWHRDQGVNPDSKDSIFGGWLNLDDIDQYFSCVKKSHRTKPKTTGFVKQEKPESCDSIKVPPGHWIVFYQNLLHEVKGGKIRNDSLRLYLGWRLTDDTNPLFPENLDRIVRLESPRIPSGQEPDMYSGNHSSFHLDDLISWSVSTFKPMFLEDKVCGEGTKNPGRKYTIVKKRKLPGLNMLLGSNIPNYPNYATSELAMHIPHPFIEPELEPPAKRIKLE